MHQTVTRRYASPAAFEAELQSLSTRGWTVRGFDRTAGPGRRAFHHHRSQIVVTYARSDDGVELAPAVPQPPAPEPESPWLNLKVPWLASRWGKVLAAAGAAIVILGVLTGRAPNPSAAQGVTIEALGQVSNAQLPKDPQAVVYTRDLTALLTRYSASLDTLTSLTSKPQMENGGWQSRLRSTTEALRNADANLRLLAPPACLASIHSQLTDAATGIDKAADRIDGSLRVQSTSGVKQWSQAALSVGGAMRDLAAKAPAARC